MAFYLLNEDGTKLYLEDLSGFLLLEEESLAPTVDYQGGGSKKRRRNRSYELYDQMGQTLRRLLSGEAIEPAVVLAQAGPSRLVLDTTESLHASAQQLTRLAQRHETLARTIADLAEAFTEYDRAKQREVDEEEFFLMVA